MSPSAAILLALLLAPMAGPSPVRASERRADPVALLRRTLRYWWKVYKTYHEEVALGYCWAGYLLEMSGELSASPSAPPFATAAASGGVDGMIAAAAARSQRNPFPASVTAVATRRRGRRSWQKRSPATTTAAAAVGAVISSSMAEPDGRPIAPRWKITQRQRRWTLNETVVTGGAQVDGGADGAERITTAIDFYIKRRRRASVDAPGLPHDGRQLARGRVSSSRGTSWRVVNPMPNPEDDEGAGRGSSWDHVGDARRKVLRSATEKRHGGSSVVGPRSFSLRGGGSRRSLVADSRGGRSLSRRWLPGGGPRTGGPSFEPRGRGTTTAVPEGRRATFRGNDRQPSTAVSQFRRAGARPERRRTSVVKSATDSDSPSGNSSRGPTTAINLRTSRGRKSGELPRGDAERRPFETRGANETGAIERWNLLRPGATGHDAEKRLDRRSRADGESRGGSDVSPARKTIHPGRRDGRFLPPGLGRPPRQMPRESGGSRAAPLTERPSEATREGDEGSATRGSTAEDPDASSSRDRIVRSRSYVRSIVAGVLRTLGAFVQVGRQIMDVVESNAALACTWEYLSSKIINWIDA